MSSGVALYRRAGDGIEIFLTHPGGPFWKNKDDGAWTFPKGEYVEPEEPLAAARREFTEETEFSLSGEPIDLGTVKQKGGKHVRLYAFEGDCDADAIRSNSFETEWPPRSGRYMTFPEVDRAGWFTPDAARRKLLASQVEFVDRLLTLVAE
ncbi:MAG TPA: NUDIX domain-containing protein [Gemmatimonadaceae bacterium]|nr:NUDIX domain-containing protein [Gemmatimonadaceae bacterium]